MTQTKASKPVEVCPCMTPFLSIFWVIGFAALIEGIVAQSLTFALIGLGVALLMTLVCLPFLYPHISISTDGIHIQRKHGHTLELHPWEEFQCVYTFRAGITYKYCGLLFTSTPLNKTEQFAAAKACQQGMLRPILTHNGHMWVGASPLMLDALYARMPAHIKRMPETDCANVNMRFTKLI